MRAHFLVSHKTFVVAAMVIIFALRSGDSFAQVAVRPTPKQEENLKKFLQDYRKDPLYDYKTIRYYSAFVDLKDDGVREVIIYFTDRHSCASGGCTTLILRPKGLAYEVVTSLTIAWPPIRVLASKSNGWHDIGVQVHGGSTESPYEAKLSFNGRAYPRNPSVPPAQRLTKKVAGQIVVPLKALTGGDMPLF